MNSFNYYAFGAVCEWMFENAAGIRASAPAERADELTFISMEEGYAQFEASSGDYSFFIKE